MSTNASNIILNFFGETKKKKKPESVDNLRETISKLFFFSPEDAKEILLTYNENGDKLMIENDEDLNLFEKINHLFSFESKISEHFQFLDINIVSTIENFLIQKEIYENEMKNTIESLPLNEIFIKEITHI